MKQLKSKGIFVLLVAIVVGYAYVFEYRGKIEKEAQEQQAKKIIPFSLEEISEFTVTTTNSESTFKKETEGKTVKWFMEKPQRDLASYGAVQGYLSQFGAEVYEEVAAEGSNIDYAIYGLTDKVNSVSFRKPTEVVTIEVGGAVGLGGKKYIRVNKQDRVLIAGYFWESQFQKATSELREKGFVPADFEISKIEIKNHKPHGIEHLTFTQVENKWALSDLITKDPDQSAVDDVYYQIKNMRAAQILKEGKSPQDMANLGLHDPEIKVILSGPKDEDKKLELIFSKNMTGQVYAATSERNVIFSMNPPAINVLRKSADDFRDKKKPLSFNLAEVQQIDYKSDLASFNLTKEANAWKSKEKIEGKEIDNAKVVDILSKLSAMKVKKYFDQEVSYQKSGMIELKLKTSKGDEVLDLKWSPKPLEDVFVAKSNLSEKTFGLSMQDVGSLPFQAVVIDPPKPEKEKTDGMHIPSLPTESFPKGAQEKKVK
ncbi:MAG: DUF4340 domain-containing protein [Bdellovibrionota bacterium]